MNTRANRLALCSGATIACALLTTLPSIADPPLAHNAMPGVYRTGFAAPVVPLVTGAFSLGYGYTESQGDGDGGHHRQVARAAVGLSPLPWLGASIRLDERYDYHSRDGLGNGSDDGWLLEPTLGLRGVFRVAKSFYVGPDLSLWTPGTGDAASSLDSTTLDARVLATSATDHLFSGVALGYRFDRSAHAGENVARMSPSDRLALGLSDFDAILVGAGVAYAPGRTCFKGELSGDLLIGAGAPSLSESPLRAAAGVSQALGSGLSAEALVEVSLSSRPPATLGALVPVEPRITGLLGLRYYPPRVAAEPTGPAEPGPPPPASTPAPVTTPPPPVPAAPVTVALDVRLTDDAGLPITSARLRLELAGQSYTLTHLGEGKYHLDAVPPGTGKLHAEAEGYAPAERALEIGRSPLELDLRVAAALPAGQVRGLVRSFRGKPVKAKVRIEPGGVQADTDADGVFEIDVQPGDYDVVIEAPGFVAQRRHVSVKERGVVVLNADLVELQR